MALTISSAHPVNQPIARAVSASDMSPTQGSAAEKDQRLPSVGEVLNQRMQTLRQATRDMLKTLHTVSESRKAAARQRLELVKERIKMLKMLVSSGLASKGVLREIRALAKELGQVAKELSGNSPAVAASDASQNSQDDGGEQAALTAEEDLLTSGIATEHEHKAEYEEELEANSVHANEGSEESAGDAEVKAQAEREANSLGFYLQNQNNSDANQRRQDAESIKEALSLLKSLVAMVKSLGWNDPESRKELEKINNLLSDAESIATNMTGSIVGGITLGNIVSVNI